MAMPTLTIPVQIRAQDGHAGGRGDILCGKPTLRSRVGKAAALFLVGVGVGALLLPVPLIHLFGVMFFLGMCGLAARRLISRTVLRGATGRCPSCDTEQGFFVGLGGRKLTFPVKTSCPQCHVALELEPVSPGSTFS